MMATRRNARRWSRLAWPLPTPLLPEAHRAMTGARAHDKLCRPGVAPAGGAAGMAQGSASDRACGPLRDNPNRRGCSERLSKPQYACSA